mmetsp:Transcript_28845/g.29266  ORF Transcript_28845/g.29266 Transcript_28845/m.29266 type:complete len:119 (-) Transcript_28845:311-667(-)
MPPHWRQPIVKNVPRKQKRRRMHAFGTVSTVEKAGEEKNNNQSLCLSYSIIPCLNLGNYGNYYTGIHLYCKEEHPNTNSRNAVAVACFFFSSATQSSPSRKQQQQQQVQKLCNEVLRV